MPGDGFSGSVCRSDEGEHLCGKFCCTGRRRKRFSDGVNAVEQLLFLTLEQRLVTFLLDESAEEGSDELHFTQERIAVVIGSAREVETRGLKKLAKEGLIQLFRGGVRILDRKGLYGKL